MKRIRFSVTNKFLEAAAVLALITLTSVPLAHYGNLPSEVPSHYCFRGIPDDWSGKASIWTLPFIGFLLYSGMSLLNFFVVAKIRAADAKKKDEPVPREKILTLIQVLKLFLLLTFGYIVWMTIRVAQGRAEGLGVWFLPAFIVLMTFLPIVFLVAGSGIKKSKK